MMRRKRREGTVLDNPLRAIDAMGPHDRRTVIVLGTSLGLLASWQALFHEVGFRLFDGAGGQTGDLLVLANCILSYAGIAVGVLLALLCDRGASRGRGFAFWCGRAASSLAVVAIAGFTLIALFHIAVAYGHYLAALLSVLLASSLAYLLVFRLLSRALELDGRLLVAVAILAIALQAVIDQVVMPFAQVVGEGHFEIIPHALTWACFLAVQQTWATGKNAAATSALREPPQKSRLARLSPLPAGLGLHFAAFFFILGMAHLSISSLSDAEFFNVPRLVGYALAAGAGALLLSDPKRIAFPWPLVRTAVFPAIMLAYMTIPLLSLEGMPGAQDAHVIPVAFIQLGTTLYEWFVVLLVAYVAREARRAPADILAPMLVIRSVAGIAGLVACGWASQAGAFQNPLAETLLSMAAFLILVMGAFWVGDDATARKGWGLRVELTPQKYLEAERKKRVAELAAAYDLTKKESETLDMLAAGMKPARIAEVKTVSINTVRSHMKGIYSKLGVHSSAELDELINGSSR